MFHFTFNFLQFQFQSGVQPILPTIFGHIALIDTSQRTLRTVWVEADASTSVGKGLAQFIMNEMQFMTSMLSALANWQIGELAN